MDNWKTIGDFDLMTLVVIKLGSKVYNRGKYWSCNKLDTFCGKEFLK
jgi:hypothetical protein